MDRAAFKIDSAEKRLNELGYKQELRREMTLFKTLAITFSSMAVFTGSPLYGPSLRYAGPASLIWGWVVVTFFTWFVGIAMAEICSSFPTTGSLYFWAAHLAGPKWGPLASWCCAWLETIGAVAGIGGQETTRAEATSLQEVFSCVCTWVSPSYGRCSTASLYKSLHSLTLSPCGGRLICCLSSYSLFSLSKGSFHEHSRVFISSCNLPPPPRKLKQSCLSSVGLLAHENMQVIGGLVVIVMLPLVAPHTQSASFVFTHFETSPEATGISSKPYAVILSVLLSNYCLYGYDTAAHLTEETKGADRTGPIAILSSIGMVSVFGWAYYLALTFSIQDFNYLYDVNNETAGALVPAQIIFDAFHGRYHNSTGAVVFLCITWGSYFFCGLSVTTSAARVVYALSRDNGIPFSPIWRRIHPKYKVPTNAVWLCAAISIILGLPILKLDVVFTAIISINTIGWVGGYAIPVFARLVMDEKNFKPGPFYLGRARRPICLVAFLWICYTCSAFLLPTLYPIQLKTFNYAPIAIGIFMTLIMLWWAFDARKWFKGPVRNIDLGNGHS